VHFAIYSLVEFNIGNSLDAEKAGKLTTIHRFCRAEEDNKQKLLKLFELIFSFFQVLHILWLLVLHDQQEITVYYVNVLLILRFTSH